MNIMLVTLPRWPPSSYMVKTFQNLLRNQGPISTKFGMLYPGLQPIIVCSNDDPGFSFTYFTARSNLITFDFLYEKVKTVDFSETIAAPDLKIGEYRLIELMQYVIIQGQDHFLT